MRIPEKQKNNSVRPNLTDLVTKQGFTFCGRYRVNDNQGSRVIDWTWILPDVGKIYGKNEGTSKEHLDVLGFFTVVQAQTLRKYPRRPCGSFWYHVEL